MGTNIPSKAPYWIIWNDIIPRIYSIFLMITHFGQNFLHLLFTEERQQSRMQLFCQFCWKAHFKVLKEKSLIENEFVSSYSEWIMSKRAIHRTHVQNMTTILEEWYVCIQKNVQNGIQYRRAGLSMSRNKSIWKKHICSHIFSLVLHVRKDFVC